MKLQENIPTVYLEEYDIRVNKYLTYAQIQQIVNSTLALGRSKSADGKLLNSWADREQNIDMMILLQATDIPESEWQKPHSAFLQSGLIDAVKNNIVNYYQIWDAFSYTERWDKVASDLIDKLADVLIKAANKNGVALE